MNAVKKFLSTYKLTLAGIIVGAVGGYLYYHFVGCNSGTCVITSKPLNSAVYGAVMGGLLLNIFKKENKKTEDVRIHKKYIGNGSENRLPRIGKTRSHHS